MTGDTFTGACCPLTLWPPRRWCCQKSRWSQRRRTWSSPPCWMSSSATSARWRPSITNPPVPLWKAAMEYIGNTFRCSTAGLFSEHPPPKFIKLRLIIKFAILNWSNPERRWRYSDAATFPSITASIPERVQWAVPRQLPLTNITWSPARVTCSVICSTWIWALRSMCPRSPPCRWVLWIFWVEAWTVWWA